MLSTEMMIPCVLMNHYFGWQQLNFSPFDSNGKKNLFSRRASTIIPLHPLCRWVKKKKKKATILKYDSPLLFSLDLSGKNISSQTLMKKKQQSRTTLNTLLQVSSAHKISAILKYAWNLHSSLLKQVELKLPAPPHVFMLLIGYPYPRAFLSHVSIC